METTKIKHSSEAFSNLLTLKQATMLLQKLSSEPDLCLGNIKNGCVSRSELLIHALLNNGVACSDIGRAMILAPRYQHLSLWGPLSARAGAQKVTWGKHVAPCLRVLNSESGELETIILDPAINPSAPLDPRKWKDALGCDSALITMGGLEQVLCAVPQYLTEDQFSAVNEVFVKLEMPYRVQTRDDLRHIFGEMQEDEKERFESRFRNHLNIINGLAYNVWRGQELNGNADIPGVIASPMPDWSELVPNSEQWNNRLALAQHALQSTIKSGSKRHLL